MEKIAEEEKEKDNENNKKIKNNEKREKENITIRKGITRTPHYLFYGSDAPYAQHLQVF